MELLQIHPKATDKIEPQAHQSRGLIIQLVCDWGSIKKELPSLNSHEQIIYQGKAIARAVAALATKIGQVGLNFFLEVVSNYSSH